MQLPLSLVFFTSTAGHFGYSTLETTIKHYRSKLNGNLDIFQQRFCHIKVRPDEKNKLPDIIDVLLDNDIKPIVTEGTWNRGLNHGNAYLADQYKVYSTQELHNIPYVFSVEDDSPIHIKSGQLSQYLEAAVNTLSSNKDILTIRFQRDGVSNQTWPVNDLLHRVDTYDFQPAISHIKYLYLGAKIVNDNAAHFANTQCEAAFRIASDILSNHPYRYLCFNPELASSHHIGVPNYLDILKTPEFANL